MVKRTERNGCGIQDKITKLQLKTSNLTYGTIVLLLYFCSKKTSYISMKDKDIKQLIKLAQRLNKDISKKSAMKSLVSAGILTENGEFTKPYHGLKGIVVESHS